MTAGQREVPCRDPRCGEPIIFGFNPKTRRRIPLNPTPDPAGNMACRTDQHGVLLARVPTEENRIDPFERLYMPHAATCKGRTADRRQARQARQARAAPTPARSSGPDPTSAAILRFDPSRRRNR